LFLSLSYSDVISNLFYRRHLQTTHRPDRHTHTPSRAGDRHVLWTRDRHVLWTRVTARALDTCDRHVLWTTLRPRGSPRLQSRSVPPQTYHSKQHLKRSHTTRQITAADSRLASARIISLANIFVISPKRVRIHLSVSDWEWRPHRLPRVLEQEATQAAQSTGTGGHTDCPEYAYASQYAI